jgi:hypothetical protein
MPLYNPFKTLKASFKSSSFKGFKVLLKGLLKGLKPLIFLGSATFKGIKGVFKGIST